MPWSRGTFDSAGFRTDLGLLTPQGEEGATVIAKISDPVRGQSRGTAKIADYIADVIRHQGHEAEPVDIRHVRDGSRVGTV